jgi:NAD(P)-dependent dehydrogenase (short-subunit alcohol dehydrogenase family)
MDLKLHNRTALVTGSERGTGAVIAETLEREGARVVWHGLEEAPDRALAVCGDIRNEEGCAELLGSLPARSISW